MVNAGDAPGHSLLWIVVRRVCLRLRAWAHRRKADGQRLSAGLFFDRGHVFDRGASLSACRNADMGDRLGDARCNAIYCVAEPFAQHGADCGLASGDGSCAPGEGNRPGFLADDLQDRLGFLELSAIADLSIPDPSHGKPARAGCYRTLKRLLEPVAGVDAGELATSLLNEHGSLARILSSSPDVLRRTITDRQVIRHLRAVRASMLHALRWEVHHAPMLDVPYRAACYLYATMAHLRTEQFRVLFLGADNRLVRDEVMWEGTTENVAIYPREIMRRALEVGAHHLIVAHNHPSGDPRPSAADRGLTIRLARAGDWIGVQLQDHLIFAHEGYFSMRAARMLDS